MSNITHPSGKVTQKQAESYIPMIDEAAGESDFLAELKQRRAHQHPKEEANLLVMGETGTGKSKLLIGYLQERLKDPKASRQNRLPVCYFGRMV